MHSRSTECHRRPQRRQIADQIDASVEIPCAAFVGERWADDAASVLLASEGTLIWIRQSR